LNSSHSKKNSIPSLEEYYRLLDLYHDAYDRIQAGEAGSGYGGIHFEVMHELARYGIPAHSRTDAVHRLKQLLDEYENNELGPHQSQSDEDYLSHFKDL
jgi:hypothetical protein